jgi:hypothetical protein
MERYSQRDNVLQYRAQQAFQRVMRQAADELGLDRVRWVTQQGGDGELAILPPRTRETTVVTQLTPTIDRLLREHNRGLAQEARVRLRVAVHEGLVHLDGANGYPGEAVVTVCRLVDAPLLKAALRVFPEANVALIVSDRIYRDVVRNYHALRPERFRRVTASLPDKGFETQAWIFVPDEDVAALHDLGERPPVGAGRGDGAASSARVAAAAPAPEPPAGGGQAFGSVVTHGPTAFGNHNLVQGTGRDMVVENRGRTDE